MFFLWQGPAILFLFYIFQQYFRLNSFLSPLSFSFSSYNEYSSASFVYILSLSLLFLFSQGSSFILYAFSFLDVNLVQGESKTKEISRNKFDDDKMQYRAYYGQVDGSEAPVNWCMGMQYGIRYLSISSRISGDAKAPKAMITKNFIDDLIQTF